MKETHRCLGVVPEKMGDLPKGREEMVFRLVQLVRIMEMDNVIEQCRVSGNPMWLVNFSGWLVFLVIFTLKSSAQAQETPDPPLTKSMSHLLKDLEIQNEIEITATQLKSIKKIDSDMLAALDEASKSTENDTGTAEDKSKLKQTIKFIIKEADQKILDNVLVGIQSVRLKQIVWQQEMNRVGIERFMQNNAVVNYVDINASEVSAFKTAVRKAKLKLVKDVEALKAKMRADLIASLTEEQQDKIDQLLGQEFQRNQSVWGKRNSP